MRLTILAAIQLFALTVTAQIQTPRASSSAKVEQTVGLTEMKITYSRPNVNGRVIFGDLVPYGQIWRTGANENTVFTTSSNVIFGKDTLKPGSYSLYTKPEAAKWEVIFYATTDNWGDPDEWKEENVVLRLSAASSKLNDVVESFTIAFEDVATTGGSLTLAWEKTKVKVPFTVPTDELVMSSINKVMSGPSSNDYYRAAEYYLNEGKDLSKALEWINMALDMREDAPFWMYRRKALILAEMKDYKAAIEAAKLSLQGAEAAGNEGYIKQNKASIEEWSKKK